MGAEVRDLRPTHILTSLRFRLADSHTGMAHNTTGTTA